MKKSLKGIILVLVVGLISPIFAQNTIARIYVIDKANKKIVGSRIIPHKDKHFKLILPDTNGASRTFRKDDDYIKVVSPQPRGFNALEKSYKNEDWPATISKAAALLPGNHLLGWGGRIAYYKGMAELALKKYEDALKTFDLGYKLAYREGHGLEVAHVGKYLVIAQKLGKPTNEFLKNLPDRPSFRPFKNVQAGNDLAKSGKSDEAILSYMRVITLPKLEAGYARRGALIGIVKTLQARGDNRAKDFQLILTNEYK